MKLEERATAFSKEFMRCLHSGFGQDHLTNMTIQHLRAVERAATKAAYERAKEEVHKELGPNMNHYWNSAIAVAVSNIRALADGGSDG